MLPWIWIVRAARAALAAATIAMAGCAVLPGHVQRPVSQAAAPEIAAATTLGRIAAASRPAPDDDGLPSAADESGDSGFRLLPAGDQAFDARIALARRAETSIDAQYYLIASDTSGLQFLRELSDAAARGVRVRLLVDDMHAIGQDELFAGLAAHLNVEVRLFNPLPVRNGSFASRIVFSLHDFARINRRMHNKLFIADNTFAISGGRNIADEYFGRAEPANFIDMDILASGPAVHELSAVFDAYWNSEHAYPVQSLVGTASAAALQQQFDDRIAALPALAAVAATDTLGQSSVSAQLQAGRIEQHAGRVRVLADPPRKVDERDGADGIVMSAHLELIRSAQSDVLIASTYFVPGDTGLAAIRQATAHHVSLTVMTNSLATTDEPLVHYGYAKYRHALLKMGASLYELMPGAGERHEADASLGRSGASGSLGRLHAKLAVVDGRRVFVGSMNMDRRSAHSNTEVGLIIESRSLARELTLLLQRERIPRSYRLRIANATGGIEWVATLGREQTVQVREPVGDAAVGLGVLLTRSVVPEDWL